MTEDSFHRIGLRVLNKLPEGGEQGAVVVVTSARDGEGKSFVASALAQALATQCTGQVAIVKCTPSPRSSQSAGWSDLVHSGELTDEMVHEGRADNLVQISPGRDARAALMFKPQAVEQALSALRERFSMTVIDAPSLPGCGALLRHADGCLLVVNAKNTRREVVQGALAANPIPASRLLGTVLNQRPEYVPGWLYRWVL